MAAEREFPTLGRVEWKATDEANSLETRTRIDSIGKLRSKLPNARSGFCAMVVLGSAVWV